MTLADKTDLTLAEETEWEFRFGVFDDTTFSDYPPSVIRGPRSDSLESVLDEAAHRAEMFPEDIVWVEQHRVVDWEPLS